MVRLIGNEGTWSGQKWSQSVGTSQNHARRRRSGRNQSLTVGTSRKRGHIGSDRSWLDLVGTGWKRGLWVVGLGQSWSELVRKEGMGSVRRIGNAGIGSARSWSKIRALRVVGIGHITVAFARLRGSCQSRQTGTPRLCLCAQFQPPLTTANTSISDLFQKSSDDSQCPNFPPFLTSSDHFR